jgi:hypothetical protein
MLGKNTRKITWDVIQNICDKCETENSDLPIDLNINVRSDDILRKYRDWKLKSSEIDLIKGIFGNNDLDNVILLNDFPYNFEKGIYHYVVWLRPGQTSYNFTSRMDSKLLGIVKDYFSNNSSDNRVIGHFRNNPIIRTINTIDHYHVIVK